MKISLEWLAEYLPGDLEPSAAAEALTHGGLPVETIERLADDSVLDVEVTSNRGDCLSHVGIARELAALVSRPWRDPDVSAAESAPSASGMISVSIEAADLCQSYVARVLQNVTIRPSPHWLARRLERMGSENKPLRPINNVVDVTNYVMFELGQPLHAFDLDKLQGKRIVVRRARAGEKLVTIDGKQRDLSPGMLVIADAVRPVALAGVMGGLDTEVTAATRNILLESARFDALSVRKTARSLAMGSDSSYRFERGIDPAVTAPASLRAAQLILQNAGGELRQGMLVAGSAGANPKKILLRWSKLKQVLGVELPRENVLDALRRLRMSPVAADDKIEVIVPTDRLDIGIEADLVEEVARVIGFDAVPMRDEISIRVTPPEPDQKPLATALSVLAGAGYFEAVTFSFVSDLLAADFIPGAGEGANSPDPANPLMRAQNAVRKADAFLRPSILPGLLEAVRTNQSAGILDPKLYEVGSTFWNKAGGGVEERRRLTFIGSPDLREVRGVVESILRKLDGGRTIEIISEPHPGLGRGASARVRWGGEPVGYLGKIERAVAEKLSLREIPAAAELEWRAILKGAQLVPQLQAPPRFPAVRRDLSLVLPESEPYAKVEEIIRSVRPPHLEELEYVTTYRGKPLEKGKKSVTITLVFRSPHETLTSEQVEFSVQSVVQAAREKLGASLRAIAREAPPGLFRRISAATMPRMRWLLSSKLTPAAAEAVRRHEHQAQIAPDAGLSGDVAPEEFFRAAQKLQMDVMTDDPAVASTPFGEGISFARTVVFLNVEHGDVEQDDAVDRLFKRYPRLSPGRLYTVTKSRVKVRQLPGSGR